MSLDSLSIAPVQEREALLCDFQRVAARLVRAGEISRDSSIRLMRLLNRSRRDTSAKQRTLRNVLHVLLVSLEDGSLEVGRHVVQNGRGELAVHIESVAPILSQVLQTLIITRELRRLLRFGAEHFPAVILPRTERVVFGAPEHRYRAVLINLEAARLLLKKTARPVPAR